MKQRPRLEAETIIVALVDFGTGQVSREQIRGKLQALKVAFNAVGQRFYGPGFGQSRSSFNKQVTIG